MIRLRTLGALDLRAADGHEIRSVLVRPKRLALLAYLVLATPRGFHRRDRLLTLFWPEFDAARARNALSQALYVLRRGLGPEVLVNRGDDEVGLAEGTLECDALSLEAAVERRRLVEALELYRGGLLEGFHVSDTSPEFEQWLEEERGRLRGLAARAARALAEEQEAAGDLRLALDSSRRAVELSPYDEAAVRTHLRILGRQGDRTGAARAYEEYVAKLAAEFGMEPSAGIKAWAEELRRSTTESRPNTRPAEDAGEPPPRAAAVGSDGMAPPGRSPRGKRERTRAWLAVAGAVTLAVSAGGVLIAARKDGPALYEKRIAVVPFENLSGDPALDPLGRMAADWITQGLNQTGLADVVPTTAALSSLRYVDSVAVPAGKERLRALGEETGAGIIVSGTFYRSGDSLQLRAEVTDVRRGRLLRTLAPVTGSRSAPVEGIERLRQRAVTALAPILDERIAPYARAASQPPTYEAYRDYTAGMERFVARDYTAAIRLFERAYRRDRSFTLSLLFTALAHNTRNEKATADSLTRILRPSRDRLAPYDQAMLDNLRAWLEQDRIAALEAGRRIGRLAPGTLMHAHAVCTAWLLNRPREAVEIAASIDFSRGELRAFRWLQGCPVRAHHLLGEHRQELRLARQARIRDPGNPIHYGLEGTALAALGRLDELHELVEQLVLLPDHQAESVARVGLVPIAAELRAHRYPAEARALYDRAIAWYRTHPPAGRWCRWNGLPAALYGAQRWDEARALVEELAAERPEDLHCQGYLGVLAARRGDRAAAERISAWLATRDAPYSYAWHTYWRARIAAQLGRKEAAVDLLQRALAEGSQFSVNGQYHEDADLEPLRGYRPFEELMRPKG